MDTILSIAGIYLFIFLGWFAKRVFKKRIDENTLVLISIYFLSPILVFWGLSLEKIDSTIFKIPFIFVIVVISLLFFSFIFSKILFSDDKDRAIATVSSIISNTGNLGIPLGLALFGEESVIYTSIINIVNIFLVYTIGVYFYARGEFSKRESFLKIFKLPVIWFSILALLLNIYDIKIPDILMRSLEMGAYANIVLQLFIFGTYLYGVKVKEIDLKLTTYITIFKFIFIPIFAFYILSLFKLSSLTFNILLLELLTPLAVMNVNLSALYNCKVQKVAFLTLFSSLIFMVYIFFISSFFR